MDSSGRILFIDDTIPTAPVITRRSDEPVPDLARGHLILKALDAAPGAPTWWPEMAPLTMAERLYVLKQLGRAPSPTPVSP